ncbi:MAG TPA: DUF4836 family protein [Flavipsychrobacter sp.]|nr:DUF4836 family protein [Flavipsychrobacter sp.]
MKPVKLLTVAALLMILFASCSKTPEHAKYIPKDAMMVVGLNTKELSKEIAWSAITGSKLLDELKKNMPDKAQMAEGLADAGIDVLNTTYFYFTPNAASGSYNYITAVVPLDDSKKWESYLQKNYKGVAIKEVNKRRETVLEGNIYAAWNNKVAIVRKALPQPESAVEQPFAMDDRDSTMAAPSPEVVPNAVDASKMASDMEAVFIIQKENITDDKRFCKLQEEGNDINMWMNYDVMMARMGSVGGAMVPGLALGSNLWKEAAMASGLDFEKGKIDAEMKYYVSKDLAEIYSKLSGKQVDKDMLDRLPGQNINMIFAANIAPEGIKAVMEKMGMLGLMTLGLASANLTADDVFLSFTGDMAMSVTDFKTYSTQTAIPPISEEAAEAPYTVDHHAISVNYIFAMKIKDKQRFEKLLNYAKTQSGLESVGANVYKVAYSDSLFATVNGEYLVISKTPEMGQAFIAGSYKSQAKPERIKKEVYGHPLGMFVDLQLMLSGAENGDSDEDKEMMALLKNLFQDIALSGGGMKKESFTYNGNLQLMNKDENSLLQFLDFAYKAQQLSEKYKNKAVNEPVTASEPDSTAAMRY